VDTRERRMWDVGRGKLGRHPLPPSYTFPYFPLPTSHFPHPTSHFPLSLAGQAMIEVMVGLVALIVLIAGLLQVASLTRARTDAMAAAREEAGGLALLDYPVSDIPDYIGEIDAGADGRTYSYDDERSGANAGAFDAIIVDRTVSDSSEWDVLEELPNSPFSDLHGAMMPAAAFGLVKGDASETVTLLPAVRSLLYQANEINIECDVWMTWTRGIY
jgi:hypothetical protein